jgi:hypothetical protein
MKAFLKAACESSTLATSIKVALVVGSVLALINYGDRIFLQGDMKIRDWIKLIVTYCVPFCVATYGAAKYATKHAHADGRNKDTAAS